MHFYCLRYSIHTLVQAHQYLCLILTEKLKHRPFEPKYNKTALVPTYICTNMSFGRVVDPFTKLVVGENFYPPEGFKDYNYLW